jgi:hypothetical protein
MITKEQAEELNQRFTTKKGLSDSSYVFRMNEPYLYSWMSTHAKTLIAIISKKKTIDPELLTDVYENICRSYMFVYFLMSRNRDLLVEKIMQEDQFQAFLNGKLDEIHYRYDTSGLKPDSDLIKAKNAFLRNSLSTMRKRLIPLIAEDVGMGFAPQEALKRTEEITYEH